MLHCAAHSVGEPAAAADEAGEEEPAAVKSKKSKKDKKDMSSLFAALEEDGAAGMLTGCHQPAILHCNCCSSSFSGWSDSSHITAV